MMELTESQLEEIWNVRAKGEIFHDAVPSEHPVLVSIGAQPGAGKTATGKAVEKMYPETQFTVIDGDDFRQYHPDFKALSSSPDPQAMPNETAGISAWMIRRSIQHAGENGYSIRVEGTFRNPDVPLNTIRDFHEKGYETHMVAVGVPEAVSWQGCVTRYVDAVDTGRTPRWAPKSAHDAGYEGTPLTVEAAEAEPNVGRLTVMSRYGDVAYDNQRGSDGQWVKPTGARNALEDLRNHPPQVMLNQFDAAQSKLEEQSARLGLPQEVNSAIGQTRKMGETLHAQVGRTDTGVSVGTVRATGFAPTAAEGSVQARAAASFPDHMSAVPRPPKQTAQSEAARSAIRTPPGRTVPGRSGR